MSVTPAAEDEMKRGELDEGKAREERKDANSTAAQRVMLKGDYLLKLHLCVLL